MSADPLSWRDLKRPRLPVAVEVIASTSDDAPFLLTCEHASNELPDPWTWLAADKWLEGAHWGSDLGAAQLTRELAEVAGASAVLARFSRLLIDPNRPLDSDTLYRDLADGKAVLMNQGLCAAEKKLREAYWRLFHDEVARSARKSPAPVLFSIHSFTPLYEGQPRQLDVGVLFDEEEALAVELTRAIATLGLTVRLNEPYSGKLGLIYSAQRHADASHKRAIEIEVRQDHLSDPKWRARLVQALMECNWRIR